MRLRGYLIRIAGLKLTDSLKVVGKDIHVAGRTDFQLFNILFFIFVEIFELQTLRSHCSYTKIQKC